MNIKKIMPFFGCIWLLNAAELQDPGNYGLYGGPKANQIFQNFGTNMSDRICHMIEANKSFIDILNYIKQERGLIAELAHTEHADDFLTERTYNPKNQCFVGSLTPVLKYPIMRENLRNNILKLKISNDFIPIDDIFEYRYMHMTIFQWVKLGRALMATDPFLLSLIHRICLGKDGKGDACTWIFDYQNGWKDGKLQFNNQLTNALVLAYQDAMKGIDHPDIFLSLIQVRFIGTNVTTRSILFPTNNTTLPDLSNTPFTLIHPSLRDMTYHMSQMHSAFENARRVNNPAIEKDKKIAKFSYLFALTMPFIRGSASMNEWITQGLLNFFKIKRSTAFIDEIAQSSFSFDDFYEKYKKSPQEIMDGMQTSKQENEASKLQVNQIGNVQPVQNEETSLESYKIRMSFFIANNIRAGQTFKQLIDDAISIGKDIAKKKGEQDLSPYALGENADTVLTACESLLQQIKTQQNLKENILRLCALLSNMNIFGKGSLDYQQWFFGAFLRMFGDFTKQAPLQEGKFDLFHVKETRPAEIFGNDSIMQEKLKDFSVQVFPPICESTDLCKFMIEAGSDKNSIRHTYTQLYNFVLEPLRKTATHVLEIGIGSCDPKYAFTMGPTGTVGASLRAYRKFFTNAEIYGADIDKEALFNEERIQCFEIDGFKPDVIQSCFNTMGVEFDYIVDDGFHDFTTNRNCVLEGMKHLKKEGMYIIEDVRTDQLPRFSLFLQEEMTDYLWTVVKLPAYNNTYDNNVIIVRHRV